ncbi:hypothetical protein TRFO_18798 [Tritrichomonas foetus]|uniref:EGF-like domain-containing protein n=1 Tax=Tritrichomonas foetus TaxID=1144522 RepID=A0A1J4KPU4_9EUKA|nr:hypothetical protein TRFO_18798 [Tritrichomonas foetus]|eukprot:OHT11726.1 hypothetical protein TRFO_18798 [Tritrichomonas foetus]
MLLAFIFIHSIQSLNRRDRHRHEEDIVNKVTLLDSKENDDKNYKVLNDDQEVKEKLKPLQENVSNRDENKDNLIPIDKFDEKESDNFCKLNHTRVVDDKCVCEEGYISTDPYLYGCWKCEQTCHQNAICVSPGKCECLLSFKGDGVEVCTENPPTIIHYSPSYCYAGKYCSILVNYSYHTNYSEYSFCRFNDYVVKSEDPDGYSFRCNFPTYFTGKAKFSISFDSNVWSKEDYYVTVIGMPSISLEQVIVLFMLLMLLVALGRVAYLKWRESHKFGQMPKHKTFLKARKQAKAETNAPLV